MENLCFAYRRRHPHQSLHHNAHSALAGLACILGLSTFAAPSLIHAQEHGTRSAVKKELTRRINNARKAHELLQNGDTAYNKKDYKTAVLEYSQAFDLLPAGAMNHQMRLAAADRYATAATERARGLAKVGRYDDARTLLDTVLEPEVAPAHMGAIKLRAQIDDPLRYNHALTPEHVADVVKVGAFLRKAQGAHNLGLYRQALESYQAVLRIDPFNKAARRGMEHINAAQSDYYRAARDHNRAKMLSEVDKQWQLYIPPAQDITSRLPTQDASDLAPNLRDKLAGITVDNTDLDNVTLGEALDFVRLQSRLGDAPNAAGEQTGINVILNLGTGESDIARSIQSTRVSLKARGLPLSKILDYITDQTRTQWRTDGLSVIVTPMGSTDGTLVSKTFRVPPGFLSSATTQKQGEDNDIFEDDNDNDRGLLPTKIGIVDFLKQNGISFPDGASATYTSSTNTLIVRNTANNINLVDQLIDLITSDEPAQVVVKTTIMRIGEENLKELGFEWIINPISIGGGLQLGGGTTGNSSPIIDAPIPPFNSAARGFVSGGLRSGGTTIPRDGIDTFLKSQNSGFSNVNTRAPGIFAVTGIFQGVQIQMLMRGLNQNKGTDVMVKPSIIARSGERSKVEVIREFIYPTEYEPPELPNESGTNPEGSVFPVTPAHPTAFETRNVGVTLEVEPTIGPNKQFIELSLQPELVEFEGLVNYGSAIQGLSLNPITGQLTFHDINSNRILMPIFKSIRLQNSTLNIQNGATVVLGGVLTHRKTKVEDKIPILGNIPYAGRLFRSEANHAYREAIIIMVNAEIIDPTGTKLRDH